MKRLMLMGLVVLAVGACADRDVTGLNDEVAILERGPEFHIARGADHIKVMSQNMYFGAPVEPVIAAPPDSIPLRVREAWETMIDTDFPARAKAMAAEMAKAMPHLIGLQEVAIYRTEQVWDPANEATEVFLDFLDTLLAELDVLNAHYEIAATQTTTDIEFPKLEFLPDGTIYASGVRLTDRDVILARSDVALADADSALYGIWMGPDATPPTPIPVNVYRGWTAVTATVNGRDFRFMNTHFESEDQQGLHAIRTGQAAELAQLLMMETLPLIVVGDLNSGPGRPVSEGEYPAYDLLLDVGYRDLWADGISPKGFDTCCHAGDLSNRRPMLDQRIDLVLYRNFELGRRSLAWSWLVNEKHQDLMRYGTWSSDHAGVISWIVFPNWGMAAD